MDDKKIIDLKELFYQKRYLSTLNRLEQFTEPQQNIIREFMQILADVKEVTV
jgi:hypothetical protein